MPKSAAASAGTTLELAGPQAVGLAGPPQGEAQPRNLLIFIRDQVKPEDLWLPRDWARENLPNQQWLKDNGLSFSNAFTNSAMCTAARASFFTSKFPAQHEVGLVLSDIRNPILDSQIQLNPDLPNLATVLKGQGYDVGFIGKAHLSKTFTLDKGTADTADDEVVYQDLQSYGFDDWQGPDAGQDMELQNFGGGNANHDGDYTQQAVDWLTNRAASGSDKPFCLVVSLINPHDVLSYPNTYIEGGYSEDWLQGDIEDLPPTVSENLRANLKPSVQSQWKLLQYGGQPLFSDQEKLNYLNFYGNLLKDVDSKMGEVLDVIRSDANLDLLRDTMIVSTSDHGEMGMSHGGLSQKMEVAYDEAMKVPMVWSNPYYFPGGQTTDALVSHVDFLPTVAGYLGFDRDYVASQDLRGVDYSSVLEYASQNPNAAGAPGVQDSVLFTFDDIYAGQDPALSAGGNYTHGLFPAANRIQAVRTKDYKYARYYSGDQAYEPGNWESEFYDLRPQGGDYYPDRDPVTGKPNIFKAAPLELRNLAPEAEARRKLRGEDPLATRQQRKA
ncbi:MAG: sulfatase-like hydrolase/transferase [Synechococcus sp.]|nr:sulfatase-like hydrolase/transferase [Synechococcus sp.]